MQHLPPTTSFKHCSHCKTTWASRDSFLADHSIRLIGFQACMDAPDKGVYLFHHNAPHCQTTLALRVTFFSDLVQGPRTTSLAYQTEACEGHCLKVDDLGSCKAPCENAHFRKIMQVILSLSKQFTSSTSLEPKEAQETG